MDRKIDAGNAQTDRKIESLKEEMNRKIDAGNAHLKVDLVKALKWNRVGKQEPKLVPIKISGKVTGKPELIPLEKRQMGAGDYYHCAQSPGQRLMWSEILYIDSWATAPTLGGGAQCAI